MTRRTLDEDGRAHTRDDDDGFYPGDLASRDADGYIRLAGRSKDVIVRAGVNVYPAEIERVVAALDGVREVAVVGAPSVDRGETVHAFVAGDVTEDALQAHCEARLAPYKRPAAWHLVDALPRTAADKTDKNLLRARARGDDT